MNIKTAILFSVLSVLASASANALLYSAGRIGATGEEKNMKWSDCKWYSIMEFDSKPNPGKPSTGDMVAVRYGDYSLLIDSDVNVQSFSVSENSKATAENRNIKLKRDLRMSVPNSQTGSTKATFKGCNIDIGNSVNIYFWDQARAAGVATLSLENTKFLVKGDLIVTIPANGRFHNESKAGFALSLAGKTQAFFGGSALIDSIISELPKEWMFAIKFIAKDGAVPMLVFAKKVDLNTCDIDIDFDGSVKPGKYTLLELQAPKSVIAPKTITVNGKPYVLGDTVSAGGKSAKIYLGASGKDGKSENDIIFEVVK